MGKLNSNLFPPFVSLRVFLQKLQVARARSGCNLGFTGIWHTGAVVVCFVCDGVLAAYVLQLNREWGCHEVVKEVQQQYVLVHPSRGSIHVRAMHQTKQFQRFPFPDTFTIRTTYRTCKQYSNTYHKCIIPGMIRTRTYIRESIGLSSALLCYRARR